MTVAKAKKSTIMKRQQEEVIENSMPATQIRKTPQRSANYLNPKELLEEVKRSKKKAVMSDRLARMLQLLCKKYGTKGNFVNYTYNEDMQAYAMMMLVRTWHGFDPEKSTNAFAWYTQCIKNSFIQFLNQEKRQRNIRDAILVDQGLTPSFGYTDGTVKAAIGDDEEDFDTYSRNEDKPEVTTDEPVEQPAV